MARKSPGRAERPAPARKATHPASLRMPVFWFGLILVALTLIAYQPIQHKEFIDYDTNDYVTDNPNVNQGLTAASLRWAFAWEHASNYHPLTWLSHMLDCQLFQLNPLGHHLVNLLFHLLNTLLLFWVLRRYARAIWPAFLVAALFALHPLHVESVAWIAERKDVLSGFFWFLTIALYCNYAQRPGFRRYLPVWLAMALGLLAKPMLVTLPFVLLLLDYWPLNRLWPSASMEPIEPDEPGTISTRTTSALYLLLEKAPLFALAIASSILTFLAQQSGGAVKTTLSHPLDIRVFNALVSYLGYLLKMIFPVNLAVLYPHPGSDIVWWQWLGSLLVLAVITVAVFSCARRQRYLAVGWLWYLGTLVPVIGLVQVGAQAMADRYTYLPLIGIFIMLAWAADRITQGWPRRRIALGLLTCVVLSTSVVLTRMQLTHWRNSYALFQHTLAVTENNYTMHHNFGRILADQGNTALARNHFARAVEINPGYARAHNNLGVTLAQQGDYKRALECFDRALETRDPDSEDNFRTHQNIARALVLLNDGAGAIDHYRRSLQYKSDNIEVLCGLSRLLSTSPDDRLRDGLEALTHARRACELTGNRHPDSLVALAAAYAETGQSDDAMDAAQKAIALFRSQGLTQRADGAQRQLEQYEQTLGGQPGRDRQ